VVVSNVGTLLNISRAARGIPVTTRFLTITGEVNKPVTIEVPIGAFLEDVLAAADGPTVREYAVIDGGPVMGNFSEGIVTKTTTGLVVLPQDHKLVQYLRQPLEVDVSRASQACDQCRFCTDYCPRYLLGHRIEPHKIMRMVGQQKFDAILREDLDRAWSCCLCDLCGKYACPTSLSPSRVISALLDSARAGGLQKPPGVLSPEAHPWRDGRRVPVSRLAARIDVLRYDHDAPMAAKPFEAKRVMIKLKQHVGVPATPIVARGDLVSVGDVIASAPEDAPGAVLHASISGRVAGVFSDKISIVAEGQPG